MPTAVSPKSSSLLLRAKAYGIIIVISIAALWSLRHFTTLFYPLELAARNWFVTHRDPFQVSDDFVFVALDDAALHMDGVEEEEFAASPELQAMRGEFPWPRNVYAVAVDRLLQAGARVVGIDILFSTPRAGDDALRSMVEKYPNQIVLASNFALATQAQGQLVQPTLEVPTDAIIPTDEAIPPRVGYVNFWPDEAYGVTANKGLMAKNTGIISAFHYEIRMSDVGGSAYAYSGEPVYLSFAACILKIAGLADHFSTRAENFREASNLAGVPIVSLHHLFIPALWKANLKDGAVFRNKIVVIGPLGDRFHDLQTTPKGTIPGPLLHIMAMGAFLKKAFYANLSPAMNNGIICIIAILLFCGALPIKRFWQFLPLIAILLVGYFGFACLLFQGFNLLAGIALPMLIILVTGLSLFAYQYARDLAEKLRTRRTLERYVSRNLVQEILDDRGDFEADLRGTRKNVAVLFSDIRGFTRFSENRDPHDVVQHLNEYLSAMVETVFRYNGTLDKFIGDAVMAVWGNVHSEGEAQDALSATNAAIEMLVALQRLNEKWHLGSGEKFQIGIGINCGTALFGNIGSEQKSDLTVIGDAVNLASRIESLTKFYQVPILLGESAADLLRDKVPLRFVDRIAVVGRKSEADLYAPILNEKNELWIPPWLETYDQGAKHFRKRDFTGAKALFEKCPAEDALVRLYLAMCEKFTVSPPSENESLNLRPSSGK